jgi:hypothetical protein
LKKNLSTSHHAGFYSLVDLAQRFFLMKEQQDFALSHNLQGGLASQLIFQFSSS